MGIVYFEASSVAHVISSTIISVCVLMQGKIVKYIWEGNEVNSYP
jgi:hypothetical protein